ncbi:ATP-dependent DNA helicase pif1 [Linum perenne]
MCEYCLAIMWKGESTSRSRNSQIPKFNLCCKEGKVKLSPAREAPELLKNLLESDDAIGNHFRKNARRYNSAFSFSSMGGKVNHSLSQGRGPYVFCISGQIYHSIGSLLPSEGAKPKFGELYIYDTENEVKNRIEAVSNSKDKDSLRFSLVSDLKEMLDAHNILVKTFRYAKERLMDENMQELKIKLFAQRKTDGREYDLPTGDELAALIVNDSGQATYEQDIIVEHQNSRLERISVYHPSLMALQYPLLFPYGEDGWRSDIEVCSRTTDDDSDGKMLTQCDFYAYRLQTRLGEGHTLLLSGKVFQQYVVNAYALIEAERLEWIRDNQRKLRVNYYNGLMDAFLQGDTNVHLTGKHIILSSTHTGSPRYKFENFQDAMAICRWGDVEVVEFQKRGLPHVHMLIFLAEEDKLNSASDIDSVIQAEIPDRYSDPKCYEAVTKFMIHGPCGSLNPTSSCTVEGKCTKHFPKKYCSQTTFDEDGFPRYRRRENGSFVTANNITVDNRFVVPYNRYLLLRFQAHINLEFCNKSRSIKYLFKYINKPPDRANAAIIAEVIDEIKAFLDCRYLAAAEACWRIFKFDIHHHYPPVLRMNFHLPGQQYMVYEEDQSIEDVLAMHENRRTMLEAWMDINKQDDEARKYTYLEFPQHYVWNKKEKYWKRRKSRISIGRLYYAHPSSNERYYLRVLLHIVKGCRSFEEIKTVNGITYESFKETCYALGFLADDNEWHDCLQEVSTWASGRKMRRIFATMLAFSQVSNVKDLWERNWELLSEDILYNQRRMLNRPNLTLCVDEIKDICLLEIQKFLQGIGTSPENFQGMPLPRTNLYGTSNSLLSDELHWNEEQMRDVFNTNYRKLNEEQKRAFDMITTAVHEKNGKCFFVEGPGGTGKTFLWKVISAKLRSEGKIVLCVATSGIAALLMEGGRTAHSKFHIPIKLTETSTCDIFHGTEVAELIQQASLIIWDEAPMAHKFCMEALDRTLRDLLQVHPTDSEELPFGEVSVVFGGDFRQILPVIKKGTRSEIISASLKKSYLWEHLTHLRLSQNMRLMRSNCSQSERQEIATFDSWLKEIGDGVGCSILGEANILIPPDLMVGKHLGPIQDIVKATYPDILHNYQNAAYLASRAVLAPHHDMVHKVNAHVLSLIPGEEITYLSSDSIDSEKGKQNVIHPEFPNELLNSLQIPGFPDHEIKLKVGVPIILLRNIDQAAGLCNGTRMVVKLLGQWFIEAEIISGSNIGESVFLPRMTLTTEYLSLNIVLSRRQYPVAICFAMTINKSQGQTLKQVGLCLQHQVFSHGQLYVALSRVTTRTGLKILSCDVDGNHLNTMQNIVYKEILA